MVELLEKQKILNAQFLNKKDICAIKNFKKRYYLKHIIMPDDEKVNEFFIKRLKRKRNKEVCNIFVSMKENNLDVNYFVICQKLDIDYRRIMYLSSKGYNKKDMIVYTWFYYDKLSKNNKKILSLKKLKTILDKSYLKNSSSIIDFIAAYKIGNSIALKKIFELEKSYYLRIIKIQLSKFNIDIKKEIIKDIFNECLQFLYSIIDRIILKENNRVKKYISVCMNYHIYDYIKNVYCNYNETNLDKVLNIAFNSTSYYYQDPLLILINAQKNEALIKAYNSLNKVEQSIIYDMYFKENNFLSIRDILTGEINGYDIHSTIGKFQDKFLSFYEGHDANSYY